MHPRRSRTCSRAVLGLGVAAIVGVTGVASAAPTIQRELTFIENRPPGDPFGKSGLFLLLRADATDPGGTAALTTPPAGASVTSNNNDFPFPEPHPLPFVPTSTGAAFLDLLTITPADFLKVTGRYTYTVTNSSGQTDTLQGHNLDKLEVVPFPTNLTFSNNSTTPQFSFTDPDPSPNVNGVGRFYNVAVYDAALAEIAVLPSPTSASAAPVFQVPAGLLAPGATYTFRAQSIDIDSGANPAVESSAYAYTSFTTVPETTAVAGALLPLFWVHRRCRRRQEGSDVDRAIGQLTGQTDSDRSWRAAVLIPFAGDNLGADPVDAPS